MILQSKLSGWSADDWAESDGKDVTQKKQKQKYGRDSCILQLAEKNPLHWQANWKISAGINALNMPDTELISLIYKEILWKTGEKAKWKLKE